MKRTAMRRKAPAWATTSQAKLRQPEERENNRRARALVDSMALAPGVKPPQRGTYSGSTTRSAPKSVAYRDQALLEMAARRPCLLLVPGICNHRIDTTVAAHSNFYEHGKGGARKADDCYSAWACHACHGWLDQGKASAVAKRAAFMAGHALQVLAWRQIAADPNEPPRFRRAAQRALEHLNATPIGEPT